MHNTTPVMVVRACVCALHPLRQDSEVMGITSLSFNPGGGGDLKCLGKEERGGCRGEQNRSPVWSQQGRLG